MKYIISLICFLFILPTWAADFPEKAGIYLIDVEGEQLQIGSVVFSSPSSATSDFVGVAVEIDHSVFSEHFLSMRPFRCLTGDHEWFCHLEYPYELRSVVNTDDLSDLEYQLLFIKKTPQEFGIDAWNGMYYKMKLQEDGTITGELWEGDLNSLQSPPSEKFAKPVEIEEFIPGDTSKRLFPKLKIF